MPDYGWITDAKAHERAVRLEQIGEALAVQVGHIGRVQLGLDDVQLLLTLLEPRPDRLTGLDLIEQAGDRAFELLRLPLPLRPLVLGDRPLLAPDRRLLFA